MKCLLLFCLCFISCLAGLAQHNLSGGIRTSALTYVYRLSSKEAGTLHRNHLKAVADSYLHTLTDSFFTGKKVPALAAGNYLFLSATGNRLMYRLHTSGNINAHLLSNDRELFVALKSDQGDAVENAIVRLKKKKLAFNKALQSYGPVSRRTASEINVIHENVFYKFPVDESAPVTRRRINSPYRFFQKFLHPRRYGYTNRHYARRPASYENKFSSFMGS